MRKAVCQYAHQRYFCLEHRTDSSIACMAAIVFLVLPLLMAATNHLPYVGEKKPKLRGPTTPQSSPHTVPQRVNGRLSTYRPFYFLLDLGSMVRINRLFPLFKNGVYWGYNHLLTPYYSYSFIRPSTCE